MNAWQKLHAASRSTALHKQAGAMIIEFALVALLFFTLLIGIMDFGRWLFTLNAAAEATRWGARLAAVCGSTPAQIKLHVGVMMRSGGDLQISMSSATNPGLPYPTLTCITSDCMVTVKLVGATFRTWIPVPGLAGSHPIPEFATTLSRELMQKDGNHPACP